jgi:hypothetical protein
MINYKDPDPGGKLITDPDPQHRLSSYLLCSGREQDGTRKPGKKPGLS